MSLPMEQEATFELPVETPQPVQAELSSEAAITTEEEKPGLELQFGRWLARIGVVFALITLISFSTLAYKEFYKDMGPWSKLGVLTAVSVAFIIGGFQIERRNRNLLVYGRTLAGGGLACLYYTLYGATYVDQLRVISSPFLGGVILLAWSAAVLWLAERKQSELLSVFAIALAYFSSAITPVGDFTMIANLILSLTAVIFLIRNAWTGLSYLCLVGTYGGLLRQIGDFDANYLFQPHAIAFAPAAAYLAGAWVIYTGGVLLAQTPKFEAGKRMAFLCLNNGAFVGLLAWVAQLSGFGHLGAIFMSIGGVFLATMFLVRYARADAPELTGAYLTQGMAIGTGGLAIAYSGATRGLLLTVESVFLVASGAYSRSMILRIGGHLAALIGTLFLLGEVLSGTAYPWILIVGGAVAMLANAWLARREFWSETTEDAGGRWVMASAWHIVLALALLGVGIQSQVHGEWIAPVLALVALGLTFAIYLVPFFELPPLAQLLLVGAQVEAVDPGQTHAWWSQSLVGLVTLVLAAWWPRQKFIPTQAWLQPVLAVYALATIALGGCAIEPHVSAQNWMMLASLLSLGFLAYGIATRLWAFAAAGQIYLGIAVYTYLAPIGTVTPFPWTWWAAAVPAVTVYATAWLAQRWIPRAGALGAEAIESLEYGAYLYQMVALGLFARWVVGVVPEAEQALAFLVGGTALLMINLRWASRFGVVCSYALDFVGVGLYVVHQSDYGPHPCTWVDAGACVLFLAQPALLRAWGRGWITGLENWVVSLASTAMTWLFISNAITATGSHNLTLGWALFAVALIVLGFVVGERRQRWCGLGVLLASIIRIGVYDFWGYSDPYKVLTFFVLTVICLGLSFLYYKFGDRLKTWL